MTIEQALSEFFDSDIRRRGQDYYEDGRVHLLHEGANELSACVQGSRNYYCTLRSESSQRLKQALVSISCNCPYFGKVGSCKHIWALVLEAGCQGWGREIAAAQRVLVEEDFSPAEAPEQIDALASLSDKRSRKRDGLPSSGSRLQTAPPKKATTTWEQFRKQISHQPERALINYSEVLEERPAGDRLLFYALQLGLELEGHELLLRFFSRDVLQTGRPGAFKPVKLSRHLDRSFVEPLDRSLFEPLRQQLDGFVDIPSRTIQTGVRVATAREPAQGFLLPPHKALEILARLHREERLFALPLEAKKPDPRPLEVKQDTWSLEAQLQPHPSGEYVLNMFLSDGQSRREARTLNFMAGGRFFYVDHTLYPTTLSEQQLRDWIERWRAVPPVLVPREELDRFIGEYALIPSAPPMLWPEESAWREELDRPRPKLRLSPAHTPMEWMGEVVFQYELGEVNCADAKSRWIDPSTKCIYLRDSQAEQQFLSELCEQVGVFRNFAAELLEAGRLVRVALKFLPALVERLEDDAWEIEVENRRLRVLREFETVVEGTNDWLDLSITTKMDAQTYQLPSLLKKRKAGEHFIPIGKSDYALLPEAWVRRMELLEQASDPRQEHLRISSRQVLLLESVLDELEVEDRSQQLNAIKQKIKNFQALVPRDPSPHFQGTLRDYQREGLAWLEFLRDFGFGGCLADDMGLGKTVQVLALLQGYHQTPEALPSLIVVPRSLIGNWQEEAARFCPRLRVFDFSTGQRKWEKLKEVDVVLITYGTLRQDIEVLVQQAFGYVILDESQAIKNAASQTAKASYLLRARHRLAMSGTPIENHLGELKSLLRFLNPGLLDTGPWQKILQKNSDLNDPHIKLLNQALKPLVLRRSKDQVLKDLPPKVEHTLYCELEGEQRQLYDELRDHYRRHILPELQEGNWHKSPLILIEALLRLRQAACHPALISADHTQVSSAKLEVLMEKIEELRESGHKALIFSQFTSFLKIVGKRLQEQKITYEYLDGQTRDRSVRVARFQSDPSIPIFLISLKAGGVGLNLTAADYCFILDPWWNPAVEAQAIDRAHRIHQKNTVFAYRLIAKDTIEEKIQHLQREKREIAASLLGGDASLLQNLDLKAIRSLFT